MPEPRQLLAPSRPLRLSTGRFKVVTDVTDIIASPPKRGFVTQCRLCLDRKKGAWYMETDFKARREPEGGVP